MSDEAFDMIPDVERILRACVAQRESEGLERVPGQTELLCLEIKRLNQRVSDLKFAMGDGARAMRAGRERDAAHAAAPPWLADAAEALGEVRPEDGAPLALTWTQVIHGIRELREDRDTLLKVSRIVNDALNGESPLDREQRATKALHLVAEALGRPA